MVAPICTNDATRVEIEALPDDFGRIRDGMTRMGWSGPSLS
ncbi:hypothetical protein [Enterovirga sp. CN4-39]